MSLLFNMLPTLVITFLGTQGISLRVCGAENPSQGPWEPGALGAALILGGLETAGGALQFPSLPSDRALTAEALGSVQPTTT